MSNKCKLVRVFSLAYGSVNSTISSVCFFVFQTKNRHLDSLLSVAVIRFNPYIVHQASMYHFRCINLISFEALQINKLFIRWNGDFRKCQKPKMLSNSMRLKESMWICVIYSMCACECVLESFKQFAFLLFGQVNQLLQNNRMWMLLMADSLYNFIYIIEKPCQCWFALEQLSLVFYFSILFFFRW